MVMMNKNIEKIKPGWYIPEDVKDKFVDFCNEKGTVIQEDFAGALIIWSYLPALIRESAKAEAKGIGSVDKIFWEDFHKGIEEGMRAQLNNLQKTQPKKNI